MKPDIVIGAYGQVGEHLVRQLRAQNRPVIACDLDDRDGIRALDLRDSGALQTLFQETQPAVVYLPAAVANVDLCEQSPQLTYATNVAGTCAAAYAARQVGAKFVFFSSDYIFDGHSGPYHEDDLPNPICEYGRQKLYAEHYIALNCPGFLIIRTTVVFGWESQGKNFIYRLVERLRRGERMRVPVDQVGSPTYAPNLAEAVVELAASDQTGVFNVVGSQLANRYEFALAAAELFDLDSSLIDPVLTSDLHQSAARPLCAGMYIDKARAVLRDTPLVDYVAGLRQMAASCPPALTGLPSR